MKSEPSAQNEKRINVLSFTVFWLEFSYLLDLLLNNKLLI